LFDRIRRALNGVLKAPQALAQALSKLRKLARAEEQKSNGQKDQEVCWLK
jgi:hypothetical protein